MGLEYIVNLDGRRVVRRPALVLFCAVVIATPPLAAAIVSLGLTGDFRLVWLALPLGLMVAASAVGRSFAMPIHQLPKAA